MEWIKEIWLFLNKTPPKNEFIQDNLEKITNVIENYTIRYLFKIILSTIQFLEEIILTTPSSYMRTKPFWEIYQLIIYLSLAILVIVFFLFALEILKSKEINSSIIINKILIYPIGVIICPYILLKTIDIFNKITSLLITHNAIRVPQQSTFGSILGLLIYFIIIAILSYKLIYFYAKRFIKIILFAVLCPIILAAWCLPKYSNIVNNWIDYILGLLISQVFHALLLLILGKIVMGVSGLNNPLSLIFQIGALGVMNEVESILGKLFGANNKITPESWSNEIKKWRQREKKYKKIKKVLNKWI
ncbi:MAG: hypothetical protein ACOCRK_09370 [bacterium]